MTVVIVIVIVTVVIVIEVILTVVIVTVVIVAVVIVTVIIVTVVIVTVVIVTKVKVTVVTPLPICLLICQNIDLIDINFGVDSRRFWKKFTFRILFYLDPSLSLLLPFLLHIKCHVSHDIITPKLLEQGTCIFKESTLWSDSFYKSKCLYVCLFFCLSVCLSHFLTPFNNLFATASQSPMSKLFRYLESLGKSNEKSGLRF